MDKKLSGKEINELWIVININNIYNYQYDKTITNNTTKLTRML